MGANGGTTAVEPVGLARRLEQERSLGRVVRAIRNSLDLEQIFAAATAETAHLLPDQDCYVVQRPRPGDPWRFVAEFRRHPDAPALGGSEHRESRLPFGAFLDGPRASRFRDGATGDGFPGSWFALPLVVGGSLWGALLLRASVAGYRWSQEAQELARAVADQVEIAVQQAGLYRQAQQELAERRRAEEALRESEQRFRTLFEATPKIAVQGYDVERRVIFWNDASVELYGYTREEALGRRLEDLIIPPEMRAAVVAGVRAWVGGGPAIPAEELSLVRKDGRRVAVYSSHLMLRDGQGNPELYCVDVDLSDLRRTETALRDSEARYRLLAENSNDLVCLHGVDGVFQYVSPSSEALLGYRPDELTGRDPYGLLHPEDRERVRQEAHQVALEGEARPVTYRMARRDGSYLWFETLTRGIRDEAGGVRQLQTTSRDVTERISAQEQLKHDAVHDGLTGLANRTLLLERLELAIHRRQREPGYHYAVLFLDMDRFKVINDSLGHLVGDRVLVQVSRRVLDCLRATDLAVRLGGDEFVLFLDGTGTLREAVAVTERVMAALTAPIAEGGREVYITASIGIVVGGEGYTQAAQLLRDADIAMYRAKAQGRDRYAVFDTSMHAAALERLQLEHDLRRAIAREEFVLHYQPIVSLTNGRVHGFEGLIRWRHPERGLRGPDEFIPLAEETGMVTALDDWALEETCRQFAGWRQAHPHLGSLRMHVNLSVRDLRRDDLPERVAGVLERHRMDPGRLVLEVTEGMLIDDAEGGIALLEALRALGVGISIDDFGTGYSSLRYLQRLPVDTLKVDRSFVTGMEDNPRNHQIVEIIHTLAGQLGLVPVAEGVETVSQLRSLRGLGYGLAQGYLFSRPVAAAAAEAFIDRTFEVDHER